MPNHIHGILIVGNDYYRSVERKEDILNDEYLEKNIDSRDDNNRSLRRGNISNAIKGFKIAVTKDVRQIYGDYEFAWQRSFHDKIIRSEEKLYIARKYICDNPKKWDTDVNNI